MQPSCVVIQIIVVLNFMFYCLNWLGEVQSPKGDISYLQKFFLTYVGGRVPLHLQEDFCGTALLRYICSFLQSINLSGNILHLLIHILLYDHDLVRWTVDRNMKTAIQENLVSVCSQRRFRCSLLLVFYVVNLMRTQEKAANCKALVKFKFQAQK